MEASVIEIKVRGFHVDVFGVVNHGRYIQFFEEARWAYLDDRVELRDGLHFAGIAHSVVSLEVEYKYPARLGSILRIETQVSQAGRHSITFSQKAAISPSSETAVKARVTNVFFQSRGGELIDVDNAIFNYWPDLKEVIRRQSIDQPVFS